MVPGGRGIGGGGGKLNEAGGEEPEEDRAARTRGKERALLAIEEGTDDRTNDDFYFSTRAGRRVYL